jgi:hypothetical protein
MLLHILRIGEDLGLHEVLSLRTGIYMPYKDLGEGRGSFAVRTIHKVDPICFDVTVTLSESKLAMGSEILGYEIWEMGEDSQVHRIIREVIADQPYDYVFAIDRGRVESKRN